MASFYTTASGSRRCPVEIGDCVRHSSVDQTPAVECAGQHPLGMATSRCASKQLLTAGRALGSVQNSSLPTYSALSISKSRETTCCTLDMDIHSVKHFQFVVLTWEPQPLGST